MRPIRLEPLEHPTPRCENFDDETEVVAFERGVREHRAHAEAFTLTRDEERLDTTWWVRGASGNRYAVDVVDGMTYDACNCPDFLGNLLGTCKHLEAVYRAFRERPTLRRQRSKLGVEAPVVAVDAIQEPTLVAVGRWPQRALKQVGLRLDDDVLVVDDPSKLVPGRHGSGARVTWAARDLARKLAAQAAARKRQEEIRRALKDGRLGVDVLSKPLFPYQITGVEHLLAAGRALLADDMGLGKTVQAIAACEVLRSRGEASRILVVTSASLKDQWAREIHRYAGERAVVVGGGVTERTRAFQSDVPYKVLNYELTWRELSRLQQFDADVLILDEAQRAKNFRTKTATTLKSIPSRFLFVLTGTPVENRLDDLYSLMQLIDPDVFGPLWRFNLYFHERDARGKVSRCRNLAELRRTTAPVVLRRRKEEVLTQLPPLTEQTRYTALSPEQAELEHGLRMHALQLVRIAEKRPLSKEEKERIMRLLMKARQACNALELCDPEREERASPKLDEFEGVVSEIVAQGTNKVLVFSEWTEMLNLAAERLARMGVPYGMLHGAIPTERRPALLDRFRENPDVRVLLSTDAGGIGLNLQVATYVIHLDLPWNPARLDQRTARAHRIGQTRGVSVTYLCAETGIERGIEGTLGQKRAIRHAALDLTSDVDTVEAASFTKFLNQLRGVLEATEGARFDDEERDEAEANETDEGTGEVAPITLDDLPMAAREATEDVSQVEAAPSGIETEPPAETAQPRVDDHGFVEKAPHSEGAEDEAAVVDEPAEAAVVRPTEAETFTIDAAPPPSEALSLTPPSTARRPTSRSPRAQNRLRLAQVVLDAGFPADAVRASYEALAASIGALIEQGAPPSHAALVAAIYRELIPSGRLSPGAHGALARLHDLATLDAQGVEVDAALASDAVREATEWVERLG